MLFYEKCVREKVLVFRPERLLQNVYIDACFFLPVGLRTLRLLAAMVGDRTSSGRLDICGCADALDVVVPSVVPLLSNLYWPTSRLEVRLSSVGYHFHRNDIICGIISYETIPHAIVSEKTMPIYGIVSEEMILYTISFRRNRYRVQYRFNETIP